MNTFKRMLVLSVVTSVVASVATQSAFAQLSGDHLKYSQSKPNTASAQHAAHAAPCSSRSITTCDRLVAGGSTSGSAGG